MKIAHSLLLILTAVFTVSGCMFDSDDKDDVKKGSVSGKVTTIVTGEPVIGAKIYLVNRNAKVDTLHYTDNLKAFVDSTITDSNGTYSIKNIAPGDYGVAVVNTDTTKVIRFTSAADSDSCMFTMNGGSYSVDFIAEKLDYPGAGDDGQIEMYVYFHKGTVSSGTCTHRMWVFFVPIYYPTSTLWIDTVSYSTDQFVFHQFRAGFTAVAVTYDNCTKWDIVYDGGKTRSFEIYLPLGIPEGSKYYYDYDLSTGTLTARQ